VPVRSDETTSSAEVGKSGKRGSVTGSASSRPRKPRDSLNRSVIIDAGIAIAERDGLDGLTFQALGRELGAHATSVYRHFRDKDEFLLEILDTLRERSYGETLVTTGDWREDLRLLASRIRAHYLKHAPFAQQMSVRSTHRKNEFTNLEFTLSALETAGLTPDDAVVFARLIGNYIRSMSSFEAAVGCLDPELRAKDRVQMQLGAQSLKPEEYPHLVAAGSTLLPLDDPRVFDLGLEALIDAVAAQGARTASS